jgi:hypothetical protein
MLFFLRVATAVAAVDGYFADHGYLEDRDDPKAISAEAKRVHDAVVASYPEEWPRRSGSRYDYMLEGSDDYDGIDPAPDNEHQFILAQVTVGDAQE